MTRSTTTATLAPIVKSVTAKATPEEVFRRFTTEMANRWPLRSHSVGAEDAETVTMGLYARRRGPFILLLHGLTSKLMSLRRRCMKSQRRGHPPDDAV